MNLNAAPQHIPPRNALQPELKGSREVLCTRDWENTFDWIRLVHLYCAVFLPILLAIVTDRANPVGVFVIPALLTFVALHIPPKRNWSGRPIWARLRNRFRTTTFVATEVDEQAETLLVRGRARDRVVSRMKFSDRNTALVTTASGKSMEVYGGTTDNTPTIEVATVRRAPAIGWAVLAMAGVLAVMALVPKSLVLGAVCAVLGGLGLAYFYLRTPHRLQLGADGLVLDGRFVGYDECPTCVIVNTQVVVQSVALPVLPAWAIAIQSEIEDRVARAKHSPIEKTVVRFQASRGSSAFRDGEGFETQDIVQIARSRNVEPRTRVAAVSYLQIHEPELAAKIRVGESLLDPAVQAVLEHEKGETRKSRR